MLINYCMLAYDYRRIDQTNYAYEYQSARHNSLLFV